MPDTIREHLVVNAFCERMSKLFRAEWRPIDFPSPPDIDAHLDSAGVRTALDHTALNSFQAQRLSDLRIKSIAECLGNLMKVPEQGVAVRILLPVKGLPKLSEAALREGWAQELNEIIANVPTGKKFMAFDLMKPPCRVWVERSSSRFPGLFFGRMLHPESKEELEADLTRALEAKNLQLASSKRDGWQTILLLETTDISTINEVIVGEAFAVAAKATRHESLDSVFLFDDALRDGKNHMVWPLKFKGVIPPNWRWMDEFRQAQGALLWGWTDRGAPYIDESKPIPRPEFLP